MIKNKSRSAFTIVELIVVIAVIGILAGIVLVSYGAWRTSVATSSLKSDLVHAAATMESSRTFNNAYSLTIPTTFSPSTGNTVTLTVPDTQSFCIDGTSSNSTSIQYYIDNLTQGKGATAGTCTTRTTLPVPTAVANVTFTAGSTVIIVNWTLASPNYASQYLVQCAADPGFITGLIQQTASGGTTTSQTLTGANATTTYYCRVRAVNANGQSDWSNTGSGDTQVHSCVDTNQYGTYPTCYNYDSIPAGASIAGYWSTLPDGYLYEDGSAVSRTIYPDLFSAIGTTYGAGDGTSTFNLPDSRGSTEVNRLSSSSNFGTLGQLSGARTVTLTIPQIPLHTHVQLVGNTDDLNFTGYQIAGQYSPADGPGVFNPGVTTGATGGNQPHNVIQPSIVRKFAIKWIPLNSAAPTFAAGLSLSGYWPGLLPSGYLLEDGSAVSRTTYAALFAAIGTTYGVGDGTTTFNLPNSQGRTGVNLSSTDNEFNTMGEKYGEENHLLTINELPAHSHSIPIGQIDDKNFTGWNTGANQYPPADAGGVYNTGIVTGNTGSGGSSTSNVVQPSITQYQVIKYTSASGTSSIISPGTSVSGYWSTVPSGFLIENGSAVSRTTYANLFAVIGTVYGAGDNSTTFNLPDSRGRIGVNLSPTVTEFNTIGKKIGEKTHTLTIPEMPSHTHTLTIGQIDDQNFTGYTGCCQNPPADGPGAYNTGNLTASTGGGQAFNVIQPSIVRLFVIQY